jgi:hypothetical protein
MKLTAFSEKFNYAEGTISKTGWLRAAMTKSARGAPGGTEKVRRKTNPRIGNSKRVARALPSAP